MSLNRRHLLALVALGGTSGCLGYRVVDDEAATERRVRLTELEARVDKLESDREDLRARVTELERVLRGPRVNLVRPVEGWERVGDVVTAAVDVVDAGELTFAVNYTYPLGGGSTDRVDATVRVTLYPAGDVPADPEAPIEVDPIVSAERRVRLTIDTDVPLAETTVRADPGGIEAGEYVVVARVRDNRRGLESRRSATGFRLR